MTRKLTFAVLCVLMLVVVAAATVQGTARFTGPRWNPQVAPPTMPPEPSGSASRPSGSPVPQVHQPHQTVLIDPTVVGAILILVVAVVVGALVWRWLRQRPKLFTSPISASGAPSAEQSVIDDEPDSESVAPVVRRGLARAIEVLTEPREPSDAIVAAWLGLQEAAEDSGIRRRASETPAEFTSRIIRRAGADPGAAATLLRLYQEVRFGGAVATSADVQRAREALHTLAAAWRPADAPGAAGSPGSGAAGSGASGSGASGDRP